MRPLAGKNGPMRRAGENPGWKPEDMSAPMPADLPALSQMTMHYENEAGEPCQVDCFARQMDWNATLDGPVEVNMDVVLSGAPRKANREAPVPPLGLDTEWRRSPAETEAIINDPIYSQYSPSDERVHVRGDERRARWRGSDNARRSMYERQDERRARFRTWCYNRWRDSEAICWALAVWAVVEWMRWV